MNDGVTIDERYFDWLYSNVADPRERNPLRSYKLLCERLYRTPFEWDIRNDENRAEDGRALREEFLEFSHEHHPDYNWMVLDTSMFEMLIALSRRAAYQTDLSSEEWFWLMIKNLELNKYVDDRYHEAVDDAVIRSLRRVINRDYHPSGRGGLFPLRDPERDQREVELWYQLSAYILENFDVY